MLLDDMPHSNSSISLALPQLSLQFIQQNIYIYRIYMPKSYAALGPVELCLACSCVQFTIFAWHKFFLWFSLRADWFCRHRIASHPRLRPDTWGAGVARLACLYYKPLSQHLQCLDLYAKKAAVGKVVTRRRHASQTYLHIIVEAKLKLPLTGNKKPTSNLTHIKLSVFSSLINWNEID